MRTSITVGILAFAPPVVGLLLALVLAGSVTADDGFDVRDDGAFPLDDSPNATTVICSVTLAPPGSTFGTKRQWVYTKRGSMVAACAKVMDGVCCPCNVTAKGRPECGCLLHYSTTTSSGECTAKYWGTVPYEPPDLDGPAPKKKPTRPVVEAVQGIVKRNGRRVGR